MDKIQNNHSIKTLDKLFKIANQNPNKQFDGLYKMLHDKDLLLVACANLCNNYGLSTSGSTKEILDGTSLNRIKEISEQIKSWSYKFAPLRKNRINKHTKLRTDQGKKNIQKNNHGPKSPGISWIDSRAFLFDHSLEVPEWKDRVVQEAIRLILNVIYEPIFYQEGNNYGFRSQLSCQHAITYIQQQSRGLCMALEGDVQMAYDNIDFENFLKILKRKITDNQFLKMIKSSFHSGFLFKDDNQDTLTGIRQGSIVSTLFFNIYMHEFDKFVINDIKERLDKPPKWNETKEIDIAEKSKGFPHHQKKEYKVFNFECQHSVHSSFFSGVFPRSKTGIRGFPVGTGKN